MCLLGRFSEVNVHGLDDALLVVLEHVPKLRQSVLPVRYRPHLASAKRCVKFSMNLCNFSIRYTGLSAVRPTCKISSAGVYLSSAGNMVVTG